jgi:hypothetical protein
MLKRIKEQLEIYFKELENKELFDNHNASHLLLANVITRLESDYYDTNLKKLAEDLRALGFSELIKDFPQGLE